jgi:hypothetical protein
MWFVTNEIYIAGLEIHIVLFVQIHVFPLMIVLVFLSNPIAIIIKVYANEGYMSDICMTFLLDCSFWMLWQRLK